MPLVYSSFFLSPGLRDTNTNIQGEEKLINVTIDSFGGTQDLEATCFAPKDDVEIIFSQDSANAQTIRFRTERLKFLTLFLSISDSPEQKGNCECIIVLFIDF